VVVEVPTPLVAEDEPPAPLADVVVELPDASVVTGTPEAVVAPDVVAFG
jgi:hypothetical protein